VIFTFWCFLTSAEQYPRVEQDPFAPVSNELNDDEYSDDDRISTGIAKYIVFNVLIINYFRTAINKTKLWLVSNIKKFITVNKMWHWASYASRVATWYCHTEALHQEKTNALRAWRALCVAQLLVKKDMASVSTAPIVSTAKGKNISGKYSGIWTSFRLSESYATFKID